MSGPGVPYPMTLIMIYIKHILVEICAEDIMVIVCNVLMSVMNTKRLLIILEIQGRSLELTTRPMKNMNVFILSHVNLPLRFLRMSWNFT